MLMANVGLELFVVLITTAVTSGKGNVMILKAEVSRIRLLMYIALRGFRFGYEVDSMRVHDPCVGADFVCSFQYCSCIISIVYFDELGSLRMLFVLVNFFRRLYCRIAIVLLLLFSVISRNRMWSFAVPLAVSLLRHACCSLYATLGVAFHIPRI